MTEEERKDFVPSDFRVVIYDKDGPRKPIGFTSAWWNLRPGGITPYVKFGVVLGGRRYAIALLPNRSDSYPTPKIINRELLRQSALRAQEEGYLDLGPESEEEKG